MRYKGSLVEYSDEVFGCVDIGHDRVKDGDGLAVDIELETAPDVWYPSPEDDKLLFSTRFVHVAIAGFSGLSTHPSTGSSISR